MSARTLQTSVLVAMMFIMLAVPAAAETREFLRKVSVREVEADLEATLSSLLLGASSSASRRLESIEGSIWQTFQALPKNDAGRIAPPAVRYLVHGYFAREHGWLIKGLEPHGMQLNVTQIHDVSVLQDKAPLLVEGLLEARQADRGLAFNDIVTMVAVLEQMMFDESITLLQAAYRLNGLTLHMPIDEATLHEVLQSYLILFGQGSNADLEDVERHEALRHRKRVEIQEFEHDAVLNYGFARRHHINPFKPRLYTFQQVAEVMEDLAQQYGKWQNQECRDMKSHLKELDPESIGSVPLGLFYAQPEGSSYVFSESADYLRKIGALDETAPGKPKVYITNYVAGPSNCIASSAYYSVCCLSECEDILTDLEHHVAAPLASPEKLLTLIRMISDEVLPSGLAEKLQAIADRHEGQVPLHGRLFAQWLHFAFPHECPYPTVVESAAALTASHWLDTKTRVASADERRLHIESAVAGTVPSADELDIEGRWSDHEVLPVHAPAQPPLLQMAGAMRAAMQLIAICVALRSALAAWRGATMSCNGASKKDDDSIFALRV